MDINRVNPKSPEELKLQNQLTLASSRTTNSEPTKPVVNQSPVKNKKTLEDEIFYNFIQFVMIVSYFVLKISSFQTILLWGIADHCHSYIFDLQFSGLV